MNASVGTCTVPRLRIFFLPPHKSAAFAGTPHLTQTAGNEFRPFQGFAAGKTLGAAYRGGNGMICGENQTVNFCGCLYVSVHKQVTLDHAPTKAVLLRGPRI